MKAKGSVIVEQKSIGEPGKDANLLPWVEQWNSNKTFIGGEHVVSPKMFSGTQAEDGSLTGIAMGRDCVTIGGIKRTGVFGLSSGELMFELDPISGIYLFRGRIEADSGSIGGLDLGESDISSGAVSISSSQKSILITKPSGGFTSMGQTHVGTWTEKYGFASTNAAGQALFRTDEAANIIAGWNFDHNRIYSGTMELGSAGYIRNTADKWRLNQDGSGSFASGKFSFDAAGNAQIAGWGFDANKLYSDGNKSELRKDGSFKLASGQIVGDVAGNVTLGANVKLAWGTDPKNLLDWSGWVLGSDPVPYFNRTGTASENTREMITAPDGRYSMGWICATDWGIDPEINWETHPGDDDGGWSSIDVPVDNKYPYRYCCWVKHETVSGVKYHGTFSVSNLTGSAVESPNSTPYFIDDLATIDNKDKWYLMVGYIHPAGYQGNYIGISGIYDTTGRRISTGTEYKFMNAQNVCSFRSFYYGAKVIGARMLLYAPCVHKIDGTEPSLAQIIGNRIVTTNIDSNGIYTGTLTANQITAGTINADRIGAGAITTDKLFAGSVTADKIAAGTITADKIKVDELVVSKLDGATGSFKRLNCVDESGAVLGYISFGSDGMLWFNGDMYHQGATPQGKPFNFYAADLNVRGRFGHAELRNITFTMSSTSDYFIHILGMGGTDSRFHKYNKPGMPVDCVVVDQGDADGVIYICDSAENKRVAISNKRATQLRVNLNKNGAVLVIPAWSTRDLLTGNAYYDSRNGNIVNEMWPIG